MREFDALDGAHFQQAANEQDDDQHGADQQRDEHHRQGEKRVVHANGIRRASDDRLIGVACGQNRCFTVMEAMDQDTFSARWTLAMLVELTDATEPSAPFGTERTIRAEFGVDA